MAEEDGRRVKIPVRKEQKKKKSGKDYSSSDVSSLTPRKSDRCQ